MFYNLELKRSSLNHEKVPRISLHICASLISAFLLCCDSLLLLHVLYVYVLTNAYSVEICSPDTMKALQWERLSVILDSCCCCKVYPYSIYSTVYCSIYPPIHVSPSTPTSVRCSTCHSFRHCLWSTHPIIPCCDVYLHLLSSPVSFFTPSPGSLIPPSFLSSHVCLTERAHNTN